MTDRNELVAAILAASKVAAKGDLSVQDALTEYDLQYNAFLEALKKRDKERVSGPEAWMKQ